MKKLFFSSLALLLILSATNAFSRPTKDSNNSRAASALAQQTTEDDPQQIGTAQKDFFGNKFQATNRAGHQKNSKTEIPDSAEGAGELGVMCGDFSNIGDTWYIGLNLDIHPWKLSPKTNIGFNFGGGLQPKDNPGWYAQAGPMVAVVCSSSVVVKIPLNVMLCKQDYEYYDGNQTISDSSENWVLAVSPTINIGRKYGFYVGPQLAIGLSGKSDVTGGFRAGFFF